MYEKWNRIKERQTHTVIFLFSFITVPWLRSNVPLCGAVCVRGSKHDIKSSEMNEDFFWGGLSNSEATLELLFGDGSFLSF
jgi:hypothetical protein